MAQRRTLILFVCMCFSFSTVLIGSASYAQSSLPITQIGTLSSAPGYTVSAADGIALLVTNDNLTRYDIADPANPQQLVRRSFEDDGIIATSVTPFGNYVYMAHSRGVRIFSFGDSPFGEELATLAGDTGAREVIIVGNLMYAAFSLDGLRIYDLSDPEAPQLRGSLNTPGNAVDLAVVNGHALVADGNGGLHVIDVGNPAAPQLRTTVPGGATAVEAGNGRAYTSRWNGSAFEITIIDIGTITAPQVLHTFTSDDADLLRLAGDYLIATHVVNVNFYDVRTPTSPQLAGRYEVPRNQITGVDVAGDLVFLATGIDARILRIGGDFAPDPVTTAPEVPAPRNNGRTLVRLEWPPIVAAQFYEIEVNTEAFAPTTQAVQTYTTEDAELTLLLDAGAYNVRVRGCNSLGCGPYSAAGTITVTETLQRAFLPVLQR
jgi:hypothetical protein